MTSVALGLKKKKVLPASAGFFVATALQTEGPEAAAAIGPAANIATGASLSSC